MVFSGSVLKPLRLLALSASLGIGSFSAMTPANAFYCANCATFYQQASQYAKEVETALNTAQQLKTQLQQYENMVQQGVSLPNSLFGSISGDLGKVRDAYANAQSLGRGIQNMDQQFNRQFPGYQTYLQSAGTPGSASAADRYQKWSDAGRDNVRTALKATGVNTGSFEAEDAQLAHMVSRSQTAAGRMQAIQAGNEIASQNVQQLQKLRDLVATQITMQGNYMAQQNDRAAADDAFNRKFFSEKVAKDPSVGF